MTRYQVEYGLLVETRLYTYIVSVWTSTFSESAQPDTAVKIVEDRPR